MASYRCTFSPRQIHRTRTKTSHICCQNITNRLSNPAVSSLPKPLELGLHIHTAVSTAAFQALLQCPIKPCLQSSSPFLVRSLKIFHILPETSMVTLVTAIAHSLIPTSILATFLLLRKHHDCLSHCSVAVKT